jgi:hypothetical protein
MARDQEGGREVDPHDDLSLFIGRLPGERARQIVLFPDGQVLADLYEETHEMGGLSLPDHGWEAALHLVKALVGRGWYIDQMFEAADEFWLKPSGPPPSRDGLKILGVRAISSDPSGDAS